MELREPGHQNRSKRRWPYELIVAERIIRTRKEQSISVISIISVLGIILGVTSLTVVLSITGGFQEAFQDRILGLHPHVVVLDSPAGNFQEYREAMADLRTVPEVRDVAPSTYNEMLMATRKGRAGVSVKGLGLDNMETVLLDGIAHGGELKLLEDRPRFRRLDGRIKISDLVSGSSWSLVFGPRGNTPLVFRDSATRPSPGRARIRVAWTGVDKGVWLTIDGERVFVPKGQVSRGLDVKPGLLEIRRSEGETEEVLTLKLEMGESVLGLLEPGRLVGVADVFGEPLAPGTARYRSVELESGDERAAADAYTVKEARLPGALVGEALWKNLSLKVGDVVSLVSPLRGIDNRMLGPFGMAPTSTSFQVAGWFRSGYYEYDNRLVVVDYQAAQAMLNRGDVVQWLDVRFDDILQLESKRERLREALDPYPITAFIDNVQKLKGELEDVARGKTGAIPKEAPQTVAGALSNAVVMAQIGKTRNLSFGYRPRYKLISWEEMNANLFSALKLQKVVLTVFFLLIIAVAAFNVVGSQIMMIHDKRTSIAILKAMGASDAGIMRIFLIQGCLVSAIGTIVGLVLGLAVCGLIQAIGYPLDPEVYLISELPVEVAPGVVALVGGMALVLTTLTTLYSASRASRMAPIAGLRHLD